MRILVTGSEGRIGRAIVARLAEAHELRTLDRQPGADLVGDIGDAALLARAVDGVDAIVHVAALHAPQVGVESDAEFQRINVDATRALYAAARAARVARFVFTSTTALYGHASRRDDAAAWIDEDTAPEPITVYHRTKLAAETLLREGAVAGGPLLRIMRMSRCFPEPAALMAAYRLHRGVDARDVADAHALALRDDGARERTFVVSGATPFERADSEALKRDAPAVLHERAPALCAAFAARGWALPASIDRVYDSTRAQRELGWRPRFGFAEVLTQLERNDSEVLAQP